jgi:hypothetical protein
MRLVLLSAACAALALAACNRDDRADAHLRAAGDEAKGAVVDVGKAIDTAAPDLKRTGHEIGANLRHAGDQVAPDLRAAGEDIRRAGDKTGQDIKDSVHHDRDRNDNPND